MPPHPLTNSEKPKHQNETKFNGFYSRNNLPKVKDEAYAINLDEYQCALFSQLWSWTYFKRYLKNS